MKNPFRSALRVYVADLLNGSAEFTVSEAAESFIADNPQIVGDRIGQLVRDAVSEIVKALCSERPEDYGQLALIPGIPAGIVTAPGRIKPHRSCTWSDLIIGRGQRTENILNARRALLMYDESLSLLRPLMETEPTMTVEDALRHLNQQQAA